MLIRFSVENFLSFDKKQELVMIPGKIRGKKTHITHIGDVPLLRIATIYGANSSGKTNMIKAISFAKYVITRKIPKEASKLYCRVKGTNKDKDTKFEFEISKNGRYYAYGFSLNLSEQRISAEWLYELLPSNSSQRMLFERETNLNRVELGENVKLSDMETMRFNTYKFDFGGNHESLFIKEMNTNKKYEANTELIFFKDVYEWLDEDLVTIMPDEPITSFEYFYGEDATSALDRLNKLIKVFDTGISKVKIKEISIADFENKVSKDLAASIIQSFKNKLDEAKDQKQVMLSMRTRDAFYNFKSHKGGDPIITTIMMEHGNAFSDFEFSEESDGTRRLFELLDILMTNDENKVYVVDELERSLHPKLTYKFLELYFDILQNSNVQLIMTTHESTIMDQELLRRDEIWFVERDKDNLSHLYSLDRFGERYDKKISKAYLEGRYGAIPIFKDLGEGDIVCP